MNDEEVKKILEKNTEMTNEILVLVKSIKKYIFWQHIFSIFKILIIVIPLVVGIIYLPPLLNNVMSQYKDLLGVQKMVPDINGLKGLMDMGK